MTEDLPDNLKHLCAERPSVAAVCREIGINHQQFSKYLGGQSRPSPYNLRRIARYFGVTEALLLGPHDELRQFSVRRSRTQADRRHDPLADAFPGDLTRLRPFLGAYQVFFRNPGDPRQVTVNAALLDERNGQVYSRLVEALPHRTRTGRRWTRCDGQAAFQAGQIFIVDRERGVDASLSLYVLAVPYRDSPTHLVGTMSFLASLPKRRPASSPVVWKRYEAYRSVRELFGACGMHSIDSPKIDPATRSALGE